MINLPELLIQKGLLYQLDLYVAVTLKLLSRIVWNHRPDSNGMGVQNEMESLSRFAWIRCPDCSGICTRHPFGHFMVAEKAKLVSGSLLFQTCPHVFKTPSTVFSIVYVYFDPLSHPKTFWGLSENRFTQFL